MIDYQPLYDWLTQVNANDWLAILPQQIEKNLIAAKHGNLSRWLRLIDEQPVPVTTQRHLNSGTVQIGNAYDLSDEDREILKTRLKSLCPWRKGPYHLYGIDIDTEWRSDWKWDRLIPHITPLKQRLVLDIGCGNGYHCWRMLGDEAKTVIGIDPLALNVVQFHLIKKLYGDAPIHVLPIGIESLPANLQLFDTVFSMGVLYHRRSPIDHLLELKNCLRPDGELILETLVIDGEKGQVLVPEGRYAQMHNVWFLPSCDTLISWLARCGYKNIRLVNINVTSIDEQRTTEWMPFHSLKQFLDPGNPQITCEGLPAPKRAIFIANLS